MVKKSNKISTAWTSEARDEIRAFGEETDFSDPGRIVGRSPVFNYHEWMIKFFARGY